MDGNQLDQEVRPAIHREERRILVIRVNWFMSLVPVKTYRSARLPVRPQKHRPWNQHIVPIEI